VASNERRGQRFDILAHGASAWAWRDGWNAATAEEGELDGNAALLARIFGEGEFAAEQAQDLLGNGNGETVIMSGNAHGAGGCQLHTEAGISGAYGEH
jgi:hypothetical protein